MVYEKGFAIVGIGCRFPGGVTSLDGLWKVLTNGMDVVTSVPQERFDIGRYWHPDRKASGRTCSVSAGIVGDVRKFDAAFFGMSPKEAEVLDPQQRMVLEMAWEAFEDAGIAPSEAAGTKTAVYIGAASTDMGIIHADDPCVMGPYAMTGTSLSIIANRLSYFFDLHGPSMTIDTACSSSLVALHEACRAMEAENLPMALVGGVNVLLSPMSFVGFSKAHMLSADGRCKVFDEKGNGYVRSEGGAVILIKPLEAALRDHDAIHAVIRATGVNSDGRTSGIALPNGEAQKALLESIYEDKRIDTSRIAYVEAHGTGTAAGDPIETKSIGEVLGHHDQNDAPLWIGSVKGNLGHLETGSGMAGLAKVLNVLEHQCIPPNIQMKTPNPKIDFKGLGIRVPTENEPLPKVGGKEGVLACVNSFGFGGTNAHVLLEEKPKIVDVEDAAFESGILPLMISARSMESLQDLARAYNERLQGADAAYYNRTACACARQRERLPYVLMINARTLEEALVTVAYFAEHGALRDDLPAAVEHNALPHQSKIAFVYSGNGSQWVGMGADLLANSRGFGLVIDEIDAFFKPLAGWSIRDYLSQPAEVWMLEKTEVAQPLLFAIQVGLTTLLREAGVHPGAVTGHSVGEVAAAWAAGALTLSDAVKVIYERSALQGKMHGSGTMAAAKCDEDKLMALLADKRGVEVAGWNAPDNFTLSGDADEIDALKPLVKAQGGLFKRLPLAYAFHSSKMAPLEGEVLSTLSGLKPVETNDVRFVSSVTGEVTAGNTLTAHYWWQNVRQPVRFEAAVDTLVAEGFTHFIEVGPHAILGGYMRAIAKKHQIDVKIGYLMHRAGNWAGVRRQFAAVMALALTSDAWPETERDRTLPRYAWNKKLLWAAPTTESWRLFENNRVHPLLGRPVPHAEHVWEHTVDLQVAPWLAGHEIDETVLFPAAGYLEMAVEAARLTMKPAHAMELDNLAILRPMALSAESTKIVQTRVMGAGMITLTSRDQLSAEEPLLHLAGRVIASDAPKPQDEPWTERIKTAGQACDVEAFYAGLADIGLTYKGAFKPIKSAWTFAGEDGLASDVLVELVSRDPAADMGMGLSPALVDGALQGLFFALVERLRHQFDDAKSSYLPSWFGRTIVWSQGTPAWAEIHLVQVTERSAKTRILLRNAEGDALALFDDVRFLRVHHKSKHIDPAFYTEHWFKYPTDREALVKGDDLTALAAAVREAAKGYEWSAEKAVETEELLHWLVLAYVREAVRSYDEWLPEEFLFAEGFTVEALDDWRAFMTNLLVQNGLAEADDGLVRVACDTECPSSDVIYRTLLATEPTRWPLLTALDAVGRSIPNLLTGSVTLDSLLPERKGTLKTLLSHMPQRALLTASMRSWLEDMKGLAKMRDAQARLRVLVVGETGGSFYTELRASLDESAQCTFVIGNEVAADRVKSVFEHAVGVDVMTLEAWLREAQHASFDVALLPDGLAFHENVPAVLKHLSDALLPCGVVAMVETAPHASVNLLEGADEAWWVKGEEKGICRLASADAWLDALARAGFEASRVDEEALSISPRMLLAGVKKTAAVDVPASEAGLPVQVFTVHHDAGGTAALLVNTLEAAVAERMHGEDVKEIPFVVTTVSDNEARDAAFWASVAETLPEGTRVVSLIDLEIGDRMIDAQAFPQGSFALMQGLQMAVSKGTLAEGIELVSITGALAAIDGAASIKGAGLAGMTRVFGNECQAVHAGVLSLQDATEKTLERAADMLLNAKPDDVEVLIAEGVRYKRFVSQHQESEMRAPAACGEGAAKVLAFDMPGRLDHLYWKDVPMDDCVLAPDEVRIAVRATGLNFRDVMWAMGLLPEEALENGFSGPTMGLEASGVVTAVGENVTHVAPGDAVVGFAPACFGTVITTKAEAVAKMPSNLTFAEAASVPVVFFTSWYAISYLGHARRGESILIHGAAGGAGLAAIQIANLLGLEVYATAGSNTKRALLRRLGVKHVYNSRSLAFADEIRRDTNGRGVDLVLNSLAGAGAEKSLGLLAPFGRFLELGKRDFFADTPMFLRPFRRNLSYFGIDVDQMLVDYPDLANELFTEVLKHFENGDFRPLPMTLFASDRVQEAFQTMQQSHHIGKLVVTYEANASTAAEKPAADWAVEGTVVVTGGLGGLGRKVAERMVERGAKALVLLSRSGAASEDAKAFVRRIEDTGVKVVTPALDITSGESSAFFKVMDEVLVGLPPVMGVVHAAGVLADAAFVNLTAEACEKVWCPKVTGAVRLADYLMLRSIMPNFFVMFSSATVLLGNPGQANYVAANMALESLAGNLRAKGMPVHVIGWGPVGDVGMLLANPQAHRLLENTLGTPALASGDVLDAMETVIHVREPASHFFAIDWSRVQKLPVVREARFEGIWKRMGRHTVQAVSMAELLAGKSADEAILMLTDLIAQEVAKLMGISVKELNVHQPISDIGMDSLMVVELAVALEERIGLKIPAVSLSGGATIQTMAERFWQMLNKSNEDEQVLDAIAGQHGLELSGDMKSSVLKDAAR